MNMGTPPPDYKWVILNPKTGSLYIRRGLFYVNYDHIVLGTL
jgi:hypothetical protein